MISAQKDQNDADQRRSERKEHHHSVDELFKFKLPGKQSLKKVSDIIAHTLFFHPFKNFGGTEKIKISGQFPYLLYALFDRGLLSG